MQRVLRLILMSGFDAVVKVFTGIRIYSVMKTISLILILSFPFILNAQVLKERRVYYLDCSYSMVSNGIWDKVRDNLKNAIDNVNDETTELIVIPFAYDNKHHSRLQALSAAATSQGKKVLKDKIDALMSSKSTMTYHSDPLNDFYTHRVNPERVTYLFFMTDGQNEETPDQFLPLLNGWQGRYQGRNVYGFYVMLDKAAKNTDVERVIDKQENLWKVETADVDINLIRLHPQAIFNARNDEYFELPIYGHFQGKNFKASFADGSKYRVKDTAIKNDKLRVYVAYDGDVHDLPPSEVNKLLISMSGGGEFDFLVTENIKVKCESKPERSLKISVR